MGEEFPVRGHAQVDHRAGAAGIGVATLAAPAPASADCIGCAIGAGILGGVAAGAIIGGAIANGPPPLLPGYYPPPPPGYYTRRPRARTARRRLLALTVLRPTPSWGPAAIGDAAPSGLRAIAISGGPCRSVPDAGCLHLDAAIQVSPGRLA